MCFNEFFHPNPKTRVLDVLEPLIRDDKKKEHPGLGQVPGYEQVAGLNNSLEMTTEEGDSGSGSPARPAGGGGSAAGWLGNYCHGIQGE